MQQFDSFLAQTKKIKSTLNLKLILMAVLGILLMAVGSVLNTAPKQTPPAVGEATKPLVVRTFENELEAKLANV